MDNMGIFSALSRSNICVYNSSKRGVLGTIYIDYESNSGYIWKEDESAYKLIFSSLSTSGFNFRGEYDSVNNIPNLSALDKKSGDFWVCSDSSNYDSRYVWNGTEFVILKSNLENYTVTKIYKTQSILMLNCIYMIDTSAGNITLSLSKSDVDNRFNFVRFIKCSDDSNVATIVIENQTNKIVLYDKKDYVEFVSTGITECGWIPIVCSINGTPKSYIELKGSASNDHMHDNNFNIATDGVDLLIQRYENEVPKTVAKIGQTITSNGYNMTSTSGRLSFTNANGVKKTLISPSKDISGVAVGNKDGMVTFFNNGELYNTSFDSSSTTSVINSSTNEQSYGSEFQYRFKTIETRAYESGIIYVSNCENKTLRISIEDLNGNTLADNVSELDFGLHGGMKLNEGSNTISLSDILILPNGYDFILKLTFSESVNLKGSTTNLNDGYGIRFVPYLSLVCYNATTNNIMHDGNVKDTIDSFGGTGRIDSRSIFDGVFQSTTDVTLGLNHVNHTIVFNHSSGVAKAVLSMPNIFLQGDKITIHSVHSDAKFVDEISNTTISIKEGDTVSLQRAIDGSWYVLSRFVAEGYGNKLYYFASTSNDLTREQIKGSIDLYKYSTDWNIGVNELNVSTSSLGDYYLYFILPTDFVIDKCQYKDNCVLNGISYDIFVSKATKLFQSLTEKIEVGVYTDTLAYNKEVPSNGEILIGDGTRLGINGSKVGILDIALNETLETGLATKVNKSDVLNGACLAKVASTALTIPHNSSVTVALDETMVELSYNEDNIGLSYENGVFTNTRNAPSVLSVSYQISYLVGSPSDVTLYVAGNGVWFVLSPQYGCINMALAGGNTLFITIHNNSSVDMQINAMAQIINTSPLK